MPKLYPVPKFIDEQQTPLRSLSIFEQISEILIKKNLNLNLEKKCVSLIRQLQMSNSHFNAQIVVCLAMKQEKLNYKIFDKNIQAFALRLDQQLNNSLYFLCEKLRMDLLAIKACYIMLKMMKQFVNKLPKNLQNALVLKMASDVIYQKYGGIKLEIIAEKASIEQAQLNNCLIRLKPFSSQIISNYLKYFSKPSN